MCKITDMVLKIRAVENLCRISHSEMEENVNSYRPAFIQLCCGRHRKSFGTENDFPDRLWFNYSKSVQFSTRKMNARSSTLPEV